MGYTALLFCPDEKTARTVTQVLGELEFTVEACSEPFAAVKKLMGEHFDAVVVDCDNEQNATLLFKSARNSTSNQTSLAVAVVEGQAGVAKAFRIGANLVLTKPINIEQTKGTLRVARGLLRKGDTAKPGVPAAAPAPTPAAAAPTPKPAPKPVTAPRSVVPGAPTSLPPVPRQIPVEKPAPAALPAAAAASTAPAAQGTELFEKPATQPQSALTPTTAIESVTAPQPTVVASAARSAEPVTPPAAPFAAPSFSTAGTASAPAPAREPELPKAVQPTVESVPAPAKIDSSVSEPAPITGSVPMFSYGGSTEAQSSGGSKKIFIGIAAAVVVAIAGYFGWSQFKAHSTAAAPTSTTQPASSQAQPLNANVTQPQVPAAAPPTAEAPKVSSAISNAETNESESSPKEPVSHSSSKTEKSSSTAASKPVHEEQAEPEPEPIVVKGGKEPVMHTKSATPDAAAPSLIGMASSTDVPPTGLVPSTSPTFKPVLQRVSVSQGVSQGLLYKKVPPVYPSGALRMRIEGKVELMATISKEGNIAQIKVLSGDGQLAKAASDAVKQWKYKPYLLNGEPVEIQTEVTVNFKLPN